MMTIDVAGTTSWVEVRLEAAPRGAGTILRLDHIYHPWEELEKTYGWGAAAIAAGTSELAAREAARRTAEFYFQRAGGA